MIIEERELWILWDRIGHENETFHELMKDFP